MLQKILSEVSRGYEAARRESFVNHSLTKLLKNDGVLAVKAAISPNFSTFLVAASTGKNQWADIPWITIMDPRVTRSPTHGFYLAYLFNWRQQKVMLSLNQGSTKILNEHGAKRDLVLAERANRMRSRAGALPDKFSASPIKLTASTPLGRSYEPGHAVGITYNAEELPSDAVLALDLRILAKAYERVFDKGGTDPDITKDEIETVLTDRPQATTVTEARLYRTHRYIERKPANVKKIKNVHGYRCQACGMNFEDLYGEIGVNYIEAHHLIPLSSLKTNTFTAMNIRADFCVLCANCHRMIHRQDDPSDLHLLKSCLKLSVDRNHQSPLPEKISDLKMKD